MLILRPIKTSEPFFSIKLYGLLYFDFDFHITFIKKRALFSHKNIWWPRQFWGPFLSPCHTRCLVLLLCFLFGGCQLPLVKVAEISPAKWLSPTSGNPATLQDLQFHLMNWFAFDLNCNFGCCYKPHKCWFAPGVRGGMVSGVKQGETVLWSIRESFMLWQLLLRERVITVGTWVTNSQITTIRRIGMKHMVLINTGLHGQKCG